MLAELSSYLSTLIDLLLNQRVDSLLCHVARLVARLPATRSSYAIAETLAWALRGGRHTSIVSMISDNWRTVVKKLISNYTKIIEISYCHHNETSTYLYHSQLLLLDLTGCLEQHQGRSFRERTGGRRKSSRKPERLVLLRQRSMRREGRESRGIIIKRIYGAKDLWCSSTVWLLSTRI